MAWALLGRPFGAEDVQPMDPRCPAEDMGNDQPQGRGLYFRPMAPALRVRLAQDFPQHARDLKDRPVVHCCGVATVAGEIGGIKKLLDRWVIWRKLRNTNPTCFSRTHAAL